MDTGYGEVVNKAVDVLLRMLTTDELAELSLILDGSEEDPILDSLNKHLMIVKPELFTLGCLDPEQLGKELKK